MSVSRARVTVLGLSSLFLLAACGGPAAKPSPPHPALKSASTPPAAQPASTPPAAQVASLTPTKPGSTRALTKVSFRLDWLISPEDAPYTAALEQGFYRAAGLDVHIVEGKGAPLTAEAVGNGTNTFGKADAGVVAQLITKGLPVKILGVYLQKTPSSIVYHGRVHFSSPRDLAGHTIVATPGDVNLKLLPAVLAKYGVAQSALHFKMVDQQLKIATFLSHPTWFTVGYQNGDYIAVLAKDPRAKAVSFSSYGVSPYSNGILTSLSEIRQHPTVVRAFMAATDKGFEFAQAHPRVAVASLFKAFSDANFSRKLGLTGLKLSLQMLHSANTVGRVPGWMSTRDWRNTIAILHKYEGLASPKPLDAYYTNQFLPGSAS